METRKKIKKSGCAQLSTPSPHIDEIIQHQRIKIIIRGAGFFPLTGSLFPIDKISVVFVTFVMLAIGLQRIYGDQQTPTKLNFKKLKREVGNAVDNYWRPFTFILAFLVAILIFLTGSLTS